MRYGSVCSGIEAASTAWEPLGWEAAWFSEIEPFPAAVLAHHWPHVKNHGDFTAIRHKIASGETEAPDVLVGGTPCQAFSIAGLRRSLDDQRGQLTIQFVGLADAIDDRRRHLGLSPAIVVWENVPGVLNTADNAFGCFLAAMAGNDAPLVPPGGRWTDAGFVRGPKRALAWRVQDAQYHGLAQRRRRVFLVASAGDGFRPEQVLFEFDGVRRDSPPCRQPREGASADASEGFGVPDISGTLDKGIPGRGAGNFAGYADHLIPYVQPLKSAGAEGSNGADTGPVGGPCPTLDTTGCQAVAFDVQGFGHYAQSGVSSTLLKNSAKGECDLVAYAIQERATASNPTSGPQGKGFQPDIGYTLEARHHVQAVAFAQNTQDEVRLQAGDGSIVEALAAEPGMKQTSYVAFSEGFFRCGSGHAPTESGAVNTLTTNTGDQRISVAYGTDMYNGTVTGDVAATLSTGCGAGTSSGPSPMVQSIPGTTSVRRLTPTECERLQGFPDGHTMIPWRGKPKEECPDGPRYKALGNSMAVPVMAWIAKRIISYMDSKA